MAPRASEGRTEWREETKSPGQRPVIPRPKSRAAGNCILGKNRRDRSACVLECSSPLELFAGAYRLHTRSPLRKRQRTRGLEHSTNWRKTSVLPEENLEPRRGKVLWQGSGATRGIPQATPSPPLQNRVDPLS